MATTEVRKLTEDEISDGLKNLDGWNIENGMIVKEFKFESYEQGLVFATTVGFVANQTDHHPDLQIGYQKVKVLINTHSVDGISILDFRLAEKINSL